MSNQRVVVLTDEQILALQGLLEKASLAGPDADLLDDLFDRLAEVQRHPEGITDDMVERAAKAAYEHDERDSLGIWETFFPGDERPATKTVTEWRWFAGDAGGSSDQGEPRRSREEAEADMACVVAEADPPFGREGIESRQCSPWIKSSRTVGHDA